MPSASIVRGRKPQKFTGKVHRWGSAVPLLANGARYAVSANPWLAGSRGGGRNLPKNSESGVAGIGVASHFDGFTFAFPRLSSYRKVQGLTLSAYLAQRGLPKANFLEKVLATDTRGFQTLHQIRVEPSLTP